VVYDTPRNSDLAVYFTHGVHAKNCFALLCSFRRLLKGIQNLENLFVYRLGGVTYTAELRLGSVSYTAKYQLGDVSYTAEW